MSAHPTPLRLARSVSDVERLHDLLDLALRVDLTRGLGLPAGARENLHGMANLCCWLLGHAAGDEAMGPILAGLPLLIHDAIGGDVDPSPERSAR